MKALLYTVNGLQTVCTEIKEGSMKQPLLNRFIRYVKIDTQSDEASITVPSTKKQFDLAEKLRDELIDLGADAVELDDRCYLYAKINSNIPKDHPAFGKTPKMGFIAHLDTSPSVTGKDVNPRVIERYQGGEIRLGNGYTITPRENPVLDDSLGQTLVTTDGTTLLGADDKAGIAIIMTAAEILKKSSGILYPDIRIGFTPDEEIGRGAAHFNLKKFDADFAYTIDGGPAGEINNETFSADSAVITIKGRDIHPGEAKDVMVNAVKVAADIISHLPRDYSPETTSGKEPFIHPHHVEGQVGNAVIKFLLRAFDTDTLVRQQKMLEDIIAEVGRDYPAAGIHLDIKEAYRNMHQVLATLPHICDYLETAVKRAGLTPKWVPVRGGTDGSGLTAMGLPCPNVFTGGYNYHGQTEWVSVDIMETSVQTLLHLIDIVVEAAPKSSLYQRRLP